MGADVLLSLLLPLKPFAPNLVYNASSSIAGSVWSWIQGIFEVRNGARVVSSAHDNALPASETATSTARFDEAITTATTTTTDTTTTDDGSRRRNNALLPAGESAVVIANHVSWTDFYLIQHLAARSSMLPRCRWFAKSSLRYVPFLGWGLWAMGMPLVSRRYASDQRELARVFAQIAARRWPVWLVSFSEGTRLTARKHALAARWCADNGRPEPRHTLWPRPRGFAATVRALREGAPHVRAVYDVTVAYAREGEFLAAPSFVETVCGPDLHAAGWRFYVHAERFEIKELPEEEEGLVKWLEQRWVRKGERLEGLKVRVETGDGWEGFVWDEEGKREVEAIDKHD